MTGSHAKKRRACARCKNRDFVFFNRALEIPRRVVTNNRNYLMTFSEETRWKDQKIWEKTITKVAPLHILNCPLTLLASQAIYAHACMNLNYTARTFRFVTLHSAWRHTLGPGTACADEAGEQTMFQHGGPLKFARHAEKRSKNQVFSLPVHHGPKCVKYIWPQKDLFLERLKEFLG